MNKKGGIFNIFIILYILPHKLKGVYLNKINYLKFIPYINTPP